MYRLVEFDGVALPQANVEADISTANSQPAIVAYHGGVIRADTTKAALRLPQEVAVRCEVLGSDLSDLRTTLDALRAKRGSYGRLYRAGLDDPGAYQWAEACLIQAPEMRNAHNVYYHPLTLQFLRLTPWHGVTHDLTEVISAETTTLDWPNNGQLPITAVQLTITAAAAAITRATFVAADGSAAWSYSNTLAAGASLIIAADSWQVENNGVVDNAHLRLHSSHRIPDLLAIAVGGSEFALTLSGGYNNATVNVVYDELHE